ncbi:hypothetical protein Q5752_001880 [Cryptotrichosporon argae]
MSSTAAVPPLPSTVRDAVLGRLLPPAPPLPSHVLSRAFLERLAFLPPAAPDDEAHLSPLPADPALPLHATLHELALGCEPGATEYAHDGEAAVARVPVRAGGLGLDVLFEHEAGDDGRGWVYRGATAPGVGSLAGVSWVADIGHVSVEEDEDAGAPADYWAGFSPPPQPAVELADNHEDDYWAQYRDGTETPHGGAQTPALPSHRSRVDVRSAAPTSPAASTTPAGASATTPSPELTIIREKILSKTRSLLNRAWADFSRARDMDMEDAAMRWLRFGRAVADRASWETGTAADDDAADAGEAVARARVEAAREMYEVVEPDASGLWKLIEGAVVLPPVEGVEHEYES